MEKYICIAFYLFNSLAYSQDYSWEYANFAEPNNSWSKLYRMAISDTDEKVVVGKFRESMTIGNQTIYSSKPIGLFLAKYAANDSLLWLKTIVEAEEISVIAFAPVIANSSIVKIDPFDNIYIGLTYMDSLLIEDDVFVANDSVPRYYTADLLKYTPEGELINQLRVRGSCSNLLNGNRLSVGEEGEVYTLVGFANDEWGTTNICNCIVNSDTLVSDYMHTFLAKFTNDGTLVRASKLPLTSADNIDNINSSLYIGGLSNYAVNLNFDNYTLNYPSSYDHGAYIAQYDTAGVFKWAKYLGVKGWASRIQILDLHTASDNDILMVGRTFSQDLANALYFENSPTLYGSTDGSQDAFIVCYDSLGNVKWHEMTNSEDFEWYFKATSDSLGNIFVSGTFDSDLVFGTDTLVSSGSDDVFIRALDNEGNHLWAKNFGGTGSDQAKGLEIDSQENLYLLGGTSSNPIHFGDLTYTSNTSDARMFLAKLSKNNIGLEELNNKEALVYPNPTTGTFTIESELPVSKLEIYSVMGEVGTH